MSTTETTTTTETNVDRVQASTLQVGDVIGTTRNDSRTKVAAGAKPPYTQVIARVTDGSGRVQARNADGQIIRSLACDTLVWRGRTGESTPAEPAQEKPRTPSAGYAWPKDPVVLLAEYLEARTSADQDAPNKRAPFVTGGVLRVHPTSWVEYLVEQGAPAPKKEALAVCARKLWRTCATAAPNPCCTDP
jgi:hypothetical protein